MPIELAVDANVLFSAMLADGTTRRLILDRRLRLCAPSYLMEEMLRHMRGDDKLARKLNRTKEEAAMQLQSLGRHIEVVPLEEYGASIPEVLKDCPDPFDAEYLAVAKRRSIPLWTNDRRLKNQAAVEVLNTREVLELLGRK
ncbi:MAG: PIN domain-containing protein [Candidatus Micrarchaeota archaeon]